MRIFVATLYSSLIQCPTLSCDAILKDAWDDKTFLLTLDLRFRDEFSPWMYFGLSYTIFISSFDLIPIMIFIWPSSDWPLDHRPNAYSFNNTF